MQRYAPYLDAVTAQAAGMRDLVLDWVGISSGSYDVDGLARMAAKLKTAFSSLGGEAEEIPLSPQAAIDSQGRHCALPLGKALRFRKRPDAPLQVFLGIHYDVVYGDHAEVSDNAVAPASAEPVAAAASGAAGTKPGVSPGIRLEGGILHASGAADAKGGLVILLKALEALEASPFAARIGWEVLLNPDEELGSPGSLPLLKEAAGRNHLGLLFEPALPDGNLVGARKGSGNFTAVVRGRAAHAGRDPHLGRNAIHALAGFIVDLDRFGKSVPGLNVNVGKVEGGGPVNRVPDMAIARFNLRARGPEDQAEAEEWLRTQATAFAKREGYSLELHGYFTSPPKPLEAGYLALLEAVAGAGKALGLDLKWHPSGGVSDGNKLASAGLPNVDTLGARGGDIHSPKEFLVLDSLAERARLTALLLMRLGSGELAWPPPRGPEGA
ncbi:MAG: acetylornithine deacetylase [Fibrobacteres bacterium]|nr:acetylornithine deacetylase [Fibrobacterota bacterium]